MSQSTSKETRCDMITAVLINQTFLPAQGSCRNEAHANQTIAESEESIRINIITRLSTFFLQYHLGVSHSFFSFHCPPQAIRHPVVTFLDRSDSRGMPA